MGGDGGGGRSQPSASSRGQSGGFPGVPAPPEEIAPPPQKRGKAKRRTVLVDAADQADGGGNPVEMLRRHSEMHLVKEQRRAQQSPTKPKGRNRCDSQWNFAAQTQTFIVFDWDDTLFPTTAVIDVLECDWRLPLSKQPKLSSAEKKDVAKILGNCEQHAIEVLKRAHSRGHVVVVTLAARGWVEQVCSLFYPKMGETLRSLNIKIIPAQERQKGQPPDDPSNYKTDEEYYGLMKGRAIGREIEKFYSQYEGQTWKNVISIGDSRFERHGLIAASTAYMLRKRISNMDAPLIAPDNVESWSRVDEDDHVVRLRVKCCKLVDRPEIVELTIELDMLQNWLGLMVNLDEGFDLDLESLVDLNLVSVVEAVFKRERPVKDLPSPMDH